MARSRIAGSIALLMLMAAGATPASAQLTNGSFETGLAYPTGPHYLTPGTPSPWAATVYTPDLYDNTGVDGWDLGGVPHYNNMFEGMVASHGDRFIGFAASTEFGGFNEAFEQVTAPLAAGQTYIMSTRLAVDDLGKAIPSGGPYTGHGEVSVLLNGSPIGTFTRNTASLTWETRSFTFVAPAASIAVFEFIAQIDPVSGASSYVGLDEIGVTEVPAPGPLAVVGLAGLTVARRRRCR